ncbi:MAG TPA: hypothetical protein VNO52_12610 [Methylomirabilota bacterium]|nr:hypothetical protein [Methylomirabilota bacterium]
MDREPCLWNKDAAAAAWKATMRGGRAGMPTEKKVKHFLRGAKP